MTSLKNRKTKGLPDYIDKYVGQRLKTRRILLGMSQEKLAEKVGITFQQIQKYEKGTNRISASRLLRFSKILNAPVTFFYEGVEDSQKEGQESGVPQGMADNDQEDFSIDSDNQDNNIPDNVLNKKETLNLIRNYYSISDPDMRKMIHKMIKSMAASHSEKK